MREMSENELLMFDIIKSHKDYSNYDLVREFYFQRYGINLPRISPELEQYGTIERWIRMLKALYPNELTTEDERRIKADMEDKFREMALDRNKPIKPEKHEQTSLLMGGSNLKDWW